MFLDSGGFTDDGKQYVTSLLKCESAEELVQWAENTTGVRDAAVQAIYAVDSRSAGEYMSKTAGSIGTVNYQLQCHAHEISANEAAIDEMRDDIKTERGNLRANQRFLVGLDKDVKALQKGFKTIQNATEKPQETKEQQQQLDQKLQQLHQKVQKEYENLREKHDNLQEKHEVMQQEMQQEHEMVQQELQAQQLLIHHALKKITRGQDDEARQVSFPRLLLPRTWLKMCQ